MKIKCKGELYEGSLDMIHCGFAKWYQAFEFRNYHECFTNSADYILRFPLACILIIAVLLLGAGTVFLYHSIRKR